ncbi:hypothetical protein BGZ57DRAFT_904377 [Hyaloscypha finlandica]|nr:hypothetical protein BGZ57DRAFT_904377 [Hyaloscypha finlandica]
MPLTISGKCDRKALREIAAGLSLDQVVAFRINTTDQQSPTSVMETHLQTLWATILGVGLQLVGRSSSFFHLGGDSISAVRLVALAKGNDILLTVNDIFMHPRLFDMAKFAIKVTSAGTPVLVPSFSLLGNVDEVQSTLEHATRVCAVDISSIEDVLPSTPLQEAMMVLSIKQPGTYLSRSIYPLPASIDVERLKTAWETVYQLYPILRTRIIRGQHPVTVTMQVVIQEQINWAVSDTVDAYCMADKHELPGFGKPTTRFAIIAGTHFVWTAHHAIYDGWSTPLILNAVGKVYYGQQVPLPTGFNSFIKYYKDLGGASGRYWKEKLLGPGATTFPPLPTPDYRPIPRISLSYKVCLPDRPQSNITLATLIRAALVLLMGQYSDSEDVIFGVVVSGRNAPISGIDSIIGPTLATVPLRTSFQHNQSVEALLASIQSQSIEMIPFEQIGLQNIMQLSQNAFNYCAFQCLLVVQAPTPVEWPGLFDPTPITETIPASFAFILECDLLQSSTINLRPTFDDAVISTEQTMRFLKQFEHLIGQLIRRMPDTRIQDLEYASPEEVSEIWHLNEELPGTVEDCVHEMIDRTIAEQPDAQAICAWDGMQTYDQLRRLSGDLAQNLVARFNICAEDVVPLCFEKSMWTIVAMLGVMKAGGAILLLDPSSPASRLETILYAVQPKIILCSRQYSDAFSKNERATLIVDQTTLDGLKGLHRNAPFINRVQPSNSAIVNFTSGTTGIPKGIIIEHRSFCSSATYHASAQHLYRGSRVMQFTSYAFDPCLVEILTTLIVGGVVCVPSDSERLTRTWEVMQEMKVNWASFCPTVARCVLPADKIGLDTLVLGGEAVSQTDIELYAGRTNVIIVYGPSECTVVSTVNNNVQDARDARVIGKGVGTVCWITNPHNMDKLAAFGCVGELCIEGPALSRGYLKNEHQTKQAYILNPSWLGGRKTGDRRIYRTGDLVRYTVGGSIKFVGRKDKQVKLRGQRIELAEVEFQLRKFFSDATDLAVDLVTFKAASSNVLAAFVACDQTSEGCEVGQARLDSEATEAIATLSKHLPSYMVPTAYISMPRMPTTSSGKCDRDQLQKIASEISYDQMKAYESGRGPPPATRAEKAIHKIWSAVLGNALNDLRANDNFFRVGGNSILVIRLVAFARDEGIQISVADVFEHPQLSKMALRATYLSSDKVMDIPEFSMLGTSGAQDVLYARRALGARGPIVDMYPCTSLQETFFENNLEYPGLYLLQQVFLLPDSIDIPRFRDCWNSTVASHALLRTCFIKSNDRYLQVVIDCEPEWQEALDLELYLKTGGEQSVELGDPLSSYCIVSSGLPNRPRYFVWTTHHAMYDFWSINLVLDEIEQKYRDGPSVTAEVKFNTLIDYIGRQDGDLVRNFWRTHLLALKAKLLFAIPEGHDPLSDTTLSQIVPAKVDSTSGARIGTLIQAAWSLVVERMTGASDIVWALSLTGRNAPLTGIEEMVGPVATVVLLRVHVNPEQDLRKFLENTQSAVTKMIPFEQTGLDNIRAINEDTEEAFRVALPLIILPHQQTFGKNSGIQRTFLATARKSKVPFHVECALIEDGVHLQIMFDSVVVAKSVVQQMMANFERILQALANRTLSSKAAKVSDLL